MAADKTDKKKRDVKGFFKNTVNELKKVVWPTKNELINYTITVLVFTFVLGLIIIIFDLAVIKIFDITGFLNL